MPKSKALISSEESSSVSSGDEDYKPNKKKVKKASPKKVEKKPKSGNIGEVSFQLSQNRWVSVSEYKKKTYVNIREYYEADGEMKPGRKGISLNLEQWKNLKSHIDEIDEVLKDL